MKKKKSLIALIAVMIISVAAVCFAGLGFGNAHADGDSSDSSNVSTWDGTTDVSWYDASKTEFTLTTAEQLAGFAAIVNGTASEITQDTFSGKTIKLGADIDLGGVWTKNEDGTVTIDEKSTNWTPIGNSNSNYFAGTFDGQGHTISNMVVNASAANAGFFGYLKNQNQIGKLDFQIGDLNFKDCLVNNESTEKKSLNYTGIVVGYNVKDSKVNTKAIFSYITVNDSIVSVSGSSSSLGYFGAFSGNLIFAEVSNCTVKNCSVTVTNTVGKIISTGCFTGNIGSGVKINGCKLMNTTATTTAKGETNTIKQWCGGSGTPTEFGGNRTDSFEALPTTLNNATNYIGGVAEFKVDNEDKLLDENLKSDNNTISYKTDTPNANFSITFGDTVTISDFTVNNDTDSTKYVLSADGKTLTFGGDTLTGTNNIISFTATPQNGGNALSFGIMTGKFETPKLQLSVDGKDIASAENLLKENNGVYYLKDVEGDNANILTVGLEEKLGDNEEVVITYGDITKTISKGEQSVSVGKLSGAKGYTVKYKYYGQTVNGEGKGETYTNVVCVSPLGIDGLYYVESGTYPWTKVGANDEGNTLKCDYWQSSNCNIDSSDSYFTVYAFDCAGIEYQWSQSSDDTEYDYLKVYLNDSIVVNYCYDPDAKTNAPNSEVNNVLNLEWTKEQIRFENSVVNKVVFDYCKDNSGGGNLDSAFVKELKTLKAFDLSGGGKVTSKVDEAETEKEVKNGDTIEFEFGKSNSATVSVPYLGIGEACYVYVDGEKQNDKLYEDKGYYYYLISELTKPTELAFEYSAEGYLTERFVVTLDIVPNGDIQKNLVIYGDVTVKNDYSPYPFKFNAELSTSDRLAYSSTNQGVNSSVSGIAFEVNHSGVLKFDYYISSEATSGGAALDCVRTNVSKTDELYTVYDCSLITTSNHEQYYYFRSFNQKTKKEAGGNLGWKSISMLLTVEDGKSVILHFAFVKNKTDYNDVYDDTFAIANVGFYDGKETITYSASNNESGITATSDNAEFTSGGEVTVGSKVSLSYANESYKFYGWKNKTTGKIVSLDSTYEFICTGDAEYVAVVGSATEYVARSESDFYATLKEAAANTTSGTITLFGNHTLTENAEIKSGVTLILPYSATDTMGYAIGGSKTRTSWFDGVNPYITLTINDGAMLTINGKVIVGGVQHKADTDTSQGHTSGDYSQIVNNGSISIQNGGYLNVVGRITGSGAITAESGATIRQPFLVNDYSGGTNTKALYDVGQFPFTQFATINIECNQIVNYGAKVIGSASLFFWSSIHTENVVLVDSIENKGNGSLIWMQKDSRLEITYDGKKKIDTTVGNIHLGDFGVTTIDVYGNITAGEFYLQGYGSGDKVLAVPYTYNINVKSGATVTVNQKYKIMPGAAVTIEAGGTINIGAKGAIYVYDGLIQAAKSGKEYPSADVLGTYKFAKSGMLIVNGTLKIDGAFAGIAQTTAEGGVIVVGENATVGMQTITDGCSGGYTKNTTVFKMSGRVFGVNDFVNLETGKTYKTFATNEFILEKFTVKSAEVIDEEKWTVTLNQNMSGRFAEWDDSEQKFVVSLTFSVGGASAGVGVTVNGTECQTEADGKFTCEVKVSSATEAITYFTTNVYTALQTHTLDLTQGKAQNLAKVASGVALDGNNNYLRVLKADGSVETDFTLNAIVSYYGGTATDTVALTVDNSALTGTYITKDVALTNGDIKTALANNLTVVGADVAKFISDVGSLANAEDIVGTAKTLYDTFGKLKTGYDYDIKFIEEYLSEKLGDNYDFAGKIVKEIKVGNATINYGDSTVDVTLVYVNGNIATDTATANLSGWKWENSSVAATATYSGTYGEKTYAVTTGCTASKKAVTVKIDDKSSVYGEGIAEFTATAGGLAYSDNYNDLGITLTKAGEKDVGTYDITGSWTNNFYNVTFENGKYTITARPITVTIANQTSVYGDEFAALTATVDENDFAGGDNYDSLKVTLTKADGTDIGTYGITGTANNANYNVTFNNGTYEITARSVTVTIQKPSDLMEGKTNIVINATVTGAVNTDDYIGSLTYGIYRGETLIATVSGGTITVAEGQTLGVDTYTIKAVNNNKNYSIGSQTEAMLNVVAKNNYYTVDFGGESKTYDGKTYDPKPTVKVTDTGAEVTDFTVTATLNNQSATILNAGTYEIKVTTADGVEYTHSYTVNKKDVTVTIDKKTSVYGDKFAKLTATATKLADGEEYDILKVELTKSEGKNVGTYTITGTASNGNYNVTFEGGEDAYTITAKTITVTIADKSSVYGDEFATLTATATGLAGGEEYDVLNVKLTKAEGKNVGTYTITGKASNDNYDVKFIEGTYTISPKAVTVVIEKKEITYGQTAVADNETKLKDGCSLPYKEDFTALGITLNFSGNAPKNAGVYSVTGTASNNNYKVTFEGGENAYTIKAKDITVSIASPTSVYGETVKTLTATAKGFAYDDNYGSLGVTLTVKDGKTIKDVGTYEIIGTATTTNYNVKFTSATYTVTKKAITVLVNDAESVYGDSDSELTVTIKDGGTAYGENVYSLLNVSRTAGANAGNYDITAETAGNENYDLTITYTNAGKSVYTIKKRPVTVTVEDLSVAYTITFAELKAELKSSTENAIEGDDLGLKLIVMIGTTALDENNFDAKFAGGAHTITATISNDNYELTLNEGTLTVGLPEITVNTDKLKLEFVYGETENPFNWREMLSGYLASASDATFKVVFYKADDTATEVELNGAGEYKMQIVIVHTSEYQFADGAKKSRFFDVTVSKKNITDSIGIDVDGLKNGGYVVFSYGLIADADVNGYNVKIRTTLTKNGEIVDEIDGTGNYEFGAEIDDDNYSGSKKISFRVIPSAAQKIAKLAEYASVAFLKDAQYVPAKNLIAGITADDMLQIDDDDKAKADYAKVVTLRDNYAKVEKEMSAIKALLDDYNGGDGEKLLDAHDYIVALDSEKLGLVRLSEQGETYERLWKQASGDATEITSIANKVRDNVLFAVIALAGTALASAFVVLVKFFG